MATNHLPLDRVLFYAERADDEVRLMARELIAHRAERHTPDYDAEECQELIASAAFYA